MTINDLIEKLQKLDNKELEVFFEVEDMEDISNNFYCSDFEIRSVFMNKQDQIVFKKTKKNLAEQRLVLIFKPDY